MPTKNVRYFSIWLYSEIDGLKMFYRVPYRVFCLISELRHSMNEKTRIWSNKQYDSNNYWSTFLYSSGLYLTMICSTMLFLSWRTCFSAVRSFRTKLGQLDSLLLLFLLTVYCLWADLTLFWTNSAHFFLWLSNCHFFVFSYLSWKDLEFDTKNQLPWLQMAFGQIYNRKRANNWCHFVLSRACIFSKKPLEAVFQKNFYMF